jgi:hypothetical protein
VVQKDYESSEAGTFMPAEHLQNYPLLVELPDEASVEQARRLLQEATIASDDIEVVGTRGEAVSTQTGISAEERAATGMLVRRLISGGVIGLLIGGATGAILAGLADFNRAWGIIGCALIGLLGGALVAGIATLGKNADEARVAEAHPEFAHPVLGVRNATPEQVERAEAALREMTTIRIVKR